MVIKMDEMILCIFKYPNMTDYQKYCENHMHEKQDGWSRAEKTSIVDGWIG